MSNSHVDLDAVTKQLAETAVDALTKQLAETAVASRSDGVSFVGRSLKLNTAEDAEEVVEAINACEELDYLNLEGNTLGVEAAQAIASALERHKEFRRALWKDMFTGRMKNEIPEALSHLGNGLQNAGARLVELDLSDNAFGPIGVEGLAALLSSASCFALQTLKLNNNGLGVTGGRMLAKALLLCHTKSKAEGKELALKVFVAGRNRLENEGAIALAEVFKKLGSLEEVSMPQNGIYHRGVSALSDAFLENRGLRLLNLNDNTVSVKGSEALAIVLPALQSLRHLNLGDCLLKTRGAQLIADALSGHHKELEELQMGFNEIGVRGGVCLAEAVANKPNFKILFLNGNQFGDDGIDIINKTFETSGHTGVASFSEDEGEASDEESDENDSDNDDIEEEGDEEVDENPDGETSTESLARTIIETTVSDFLNEPTDEHLLALGENRIELFLEELRGYPESEFLEALLNALMTVSGLSTSSNNVACSAAVSCSNALYEKLFSWAEKRQTFSLVNNTLMVHFGLVKSEDKTFKASCAYNLDGCFKALDHAIQQDFFPKETHNMISILRGRGVACLNQTIENQTSPIHIT